MRFLFACSFILFFSSCREEIDFDLNESNPRIVVDGSITSQNKRHEVRITKSSSYYNQEMSQQISGATVSISDQNNVFTLTEVTPGRYLTDTMAGQIGNTYTLSINYDNQTYTATSTLEPVAPLDSIIAIQLFDTIPIINEVDSSYSLGIAITETPGLGDYYLFKYYINNQLESDTVVEYAFTDDTFIDGIQFDFDPIIPVYQIDHRIVSPGDLITLKVFSISKHYSDYLFTALLQTEFRQGTIFDGPASNIYGNVSNGALGYFYASDVSSASTVIE